MGSDNRSGRASKTKGRTGDTKMANVLEVGMVFYNDGAIGKVTLHRSYNGWKPKFTVVHERWLGGWTPASALTFLIDDQKQL